MTDKERIIFELYKEKCVKSSRNFKMKFKNKDIDAYKIYANIINYQIDKYGQTLSEDDPLYIGYTEITTKAKKAKNRQKALKYYWKNK